MNKFLVLAAISTSAVALAGCKAGETTYGVESGESVLAVGPTDAGGFDAAPAGRPSPGPSLTPPAPVAQPVIYDTAPAVSITPNLPTGGATTGGATTGGPASAAAPAGASGGASGGATRTYLVRRGDTLFGIARVQYGSGKQWQRIAAANPGLTPDRLQAGQKIVLP